jgi:putative membrane protein
MPMSILIRWVVNAAAIMATAWLLPQVEVADWKAGLIAGLLLGFLNTFVRPIFKLVALPLTVVTLGLFTLVINGVVLEILDWLMDGLTIKNFLWSIVAAIIISIITSLVNIVLGASDGKKKRR